MKYRKKPVEVEAEVYKEGLEDGWYVHEQDGRNAGAFFLHNSVIDPQIHNRQFPAIRTLEGWLRIGEGDYIITGIKGERYPCKPDIFEQTYEPVDEYIGPSISSTRLMNPSE